MTMDTYDLMIAGAGPAGMTAALYAQRMGLDVVVLGDIAGGSTYMIEQLNNFPGFMNGIPGTQFGLQTFQQAQQQGAFFTMTRLESLLHENSRFTGTDADGKTITAPSVIVASGRTPKRLAVTKASLKGVHFCSICDGPLYRNKHAHLAVIGSDNAAGQHAITLARVADKVLLVCRSEQLQMDSVHRKQVESKQNIDVLTGVEVVDYEGLDMIEGMRVRALQGAEQLLAVDGVFLAIGWQPNTSMLDLAVDTTVEGYLKTDERFMTSFPGLFAAGDVRNTDMWQVLTACADGARAAKHAADFLSNS
jgi:thioredoxin reductase (NADPH)